MRGTRGEDVRSARVLLPWVQLIRDWGCYSLNIPYTLTLQCLLRAVKIKFQDSLNPHWLVMGLSWPYMKTNTAKHHNAESKKSLITNRNRHTGSVLGNVLFRLLADTVHQYCMRTCTVHENIDFILMCIWWRWSYAARSTETRNGWETVRLALSRVNKINLTPLKEKSQTLPTTAA